MSLTQVATRKHPEHLLGQLEKPQTVRHRGLRPPDALSDIAERELELVDERRVRASFLDGRELFASNVLHESEKKGVAIPHIADDRGKHGNPSCTRRTPTAFAGDELEPSLGSTADHDRLEHALQADRARETCGRFRLEASPGLARVGVNRLDGEVEQLGLSCLTQ
jgi:hypothetical protein